MEPCNPTRNGYMRLYGHQVHNCCNYVLITNLQCSTVFSDVIGNHLSRLLAKISTGPLVTRQTDVLSHDLVKYRSRKIGCHNNHIALKFDKLPRCLSNIKAIGKNKPESRGFNTSREHVVRRPSAY